MTEDTKAASSDENGRKPQRSFAAAIKGHVQHLRGVARLRTRLKAALSGARTGRIAPPEVEKPPPGRKFCYAHYGEDLIVDYIFIDLHIPLPTYLDLGAYHPTLFSNTYLFYERGGRGVCVEPNPAPGPAFRALRPRDLLLNVGVGPEHQAEADFYLMDAPTLSTFSKATAEELTRNGRHRIERVMKIPVLTVDEIFSEHFPVSPDFISLDAEGAELDVLRGIDLSRRRPKVFCVETLTFSEDHTERKQSDTIEFLKSHDYMVYADTYINTIFVDLASWRNR